MSKPAIGLIGGLAFNAGMYYYRRIYQRHAETGTPLHLLLAHADVGTILSFVTDGNVAGMARYLSSLSEGLERGGATAIAITAVAPHMCIEELRPMCPIPLISVLDVVRDAMASSGEHQRVAIFGNRAVIETNVFGSIDASRVVRQTPEAIETIHAIYNDIAIHGKCGTVYEFQALERIAQDLLAAGAQTIVLAGTDLSAFYIETPPAYPHLNVANLHIDAILTHTLSC